MIDFDLGDKVRFVCDNSDGEEFGRQGDTGTVITIGGDGNYQVKLDTYDSHVHEVSTPWATSDELEPFSEEDAIPDTPPVWVEKFMGRRGRDIPDHLTEQAHDKGEAGVRRITRVWPHGKRLRVDAKTEKDDKFADYVWHVFEWRWEDDK